MVMDGHGKFKATVDAGIGDAAHQLPVLEVCSFSASSLNDDQLGEGTLLASCGR
jgi:hypothetical protein